MSAVEGGDLVKRAQGGEPAAIGELYRRYWGAARAAAFGVVGDEASAEDAASEGFQAALAGLKSLEDPERFGPWLRTIVIRTARRLRVKTIAHERTESSYLVGFESPAPGADLERREIAVLIREAVASLPDALREAITIRYFEGYSVEDAASFVDVPAGTFKRRLHDGRRRLSFIVEKMLRGSRPSNRKGERILARILHLLSEGGDPESFFQTVREAMQLRPIPLQSVRALIHRQSGLSGGSAASAHWKEAERVLQEAISRLCCPSERAADPAHPVGAVACAIRSALPDFQTWQLSPEKGARFLVDRDHPPVLPPAFAEGRPGCYIQYTRTLLVGNGRDSLLTPYATFQRSATEKSFARSVREQARVSDVVVLMWMCSGNLELREVEELLRRLTEIIVPGVPVRLVPSDEPCYRSALQMQLGSVAAPAAKGGVLAPWSGMREDLGAAQVCIFLEPWATVRGGEVIEFSDLPGVLEGPEGVGPVTGQVGSEDG